MYHPQPAIMVFIVLSLPQDGPWVLATARLLPGGLKQYFSAPLSVVAPPHPYPDFVMQPLALPRGCDTPVVDSVRSQISLVSQGRHHVSSSACTHT
ncbi:hypothetical protein PISMIDRAFT_371025 [Pisolithus microcarpus 441]|uniref:Uncharacterized protein n=1 Tax=Pisolithus microcarpus 441 TaxID=765257 RepID=A0A0C9Z1Q9_9AGAM|nr:hypothetical protein BKA83DRAFT_371025 [Pisolithus microcarpus]KIK13898.1 hypothetical protein PISMIDRAFT_371025 [Pisolithus microcarpus 441]